MLNPRNPYDVLNVAQGAEPVVIEAAYRALIKKYHPDQSEALGDHASRAAEINRAFALLKDPTQRAAFDHQEWKRQQALRALAAPPVLRRTSMAGWSGWLVALMMGGVLATLSMTPREAVPPVGIPRAQAAAASGSESQPSYKEIWLPEPDSSADIHRRVVEEAVAGAASMPARMTAPTARPGQGFVSSAKSASHQKRRRARKTRTSTSPHNKAGSDFLERQGYIY